MTPTRPSDPNDEWLHRQCPRMPASPPPRMTTPVSLTDGAHLRRLAVDLISLVTWSPSGQPSLRHRLTPAKATFDSECITWPSWWDPDQLCTLFFALFSCRYGCLGVLHCDWSWWHWSDFVVHINCWWLFVIKVLEIFVVNHLCVDCHLDEVCMIFMCYLLIIHQTMPFEFYFHINLWKLE